MLNKITALFSNFVIERKRDQAKAVVDSHIATSMYLVPAVMESYKQAAHAIVDKTFDKPQVLQNFLSAGIAMLDHYGDIDALKQIERGVLAAQKTPDFKALLQSFEAKLETLSNAQA